MIIFIILTKKEKRTEDKDGSGVVYNNACVQCRECGNAVGSHHEVLIVLISALWFCTIHNTLHLHLLIAHLNNIEWSKCYTWATETRVQTWATCAGWPRVVRGSRWVETAPGTPDPRQLEVGGDQSVSRPQSSCTHHSNIFHSIFKYFSHLDNI